MVHPGLLLLLLGSGLLRTGAGSKEVFGVVASSALLDPEIKGDIRSRDIIWEFIGSNGKLVTILDYDPNHRLVEPNGQFKSRLSFNASNGSLMLNGLKPSDQGVYKITVDGKWRGNRILKLIEPLSEPLINISHVNTTIELTCRVSAGKASSILWQKANKTIRNTKPYQLLQNNSKLIISEANETDCGIYSCIVENPVSKNCSYSSINGKECEPAEPVVYLQITIIVVVMVICVLFLVVVVFYIVKKCKKKTTDNFPL